MFRKLIMALMIALFILLLCSCALIKEKSYSDYEIGENFGGNIDGYQMKLPHNYCLGVYLSSKAELFEVPNECLDVPFFTEGVYNTPSIIEGRFVKGFYDENVLILYEQLSENEYEYVVFDFQSKAINRVKSEADLPDIKTIKWFSLCNTIQEGVQYKS